MNDRIPEPRVAELLDRVIDDHATDAERRELGALVDHDSKLASEVASQLRMHGLLEWESPAIKAVVPNVADVPTISSASRNRSRAKWLIAACGAFVAVGVWYASQMNSDADSVAEIVDDRLVAWNSETDSVTADRGIRPGRVVIDSGALTLRFRSGATLKAIGPASLDVRSDMLVILGDGQATAHVPHWARGFTIKTSSAEIVDLGTEFGVAARPDGQTDVIVFDGEVDLTPLPKRRLEPLPKRLIKGEAVTVTRQGAIDRIVQVQRDDRGEGWSTSPLPENVCAFAQIYDNLRATGSAMCYQIMPGGLNDDALAYVDREHQWNGLDGEGLPDFLKNADYVRTFNDDKYMGELEIVVELARPAWLYLLFDDRVPLPAWVATDFEDTGTSIGLDEGPWGAEVSLDTDVGPGQSVDRVFSVWRKKCDGPLTIRLGSLGLSAEARAMYGIAATPLE